MNHEQKIVLVLAAIITIIAIVTLAQLIVHVLNLNQ